MEAPQKVSFSELIKGPKPVIVDFYADWCGPCRMMPPILKDVKSALGEDVEIIKIDVDRNSQLAGSLKIQSIPTIIIFKNGKSVWRQSGVPSAAALTAAAKGFI
ncbi:MAG: thioredoxin [Saprospiraceae bacterium]|nr:thioredoxin [Saprospiraceae bacterium]